MRSPLTGRDVEWEPCGDGCPDDGWCAFREDDGTVYVASREVVERCQVWPLSTLVQACLLHEARGCAERGLTAAFATVAHASLEGGVGHRWGGPLHYCRVGLDS